MSTRCALYEVLVGVSPAIALFDKPGANPLTISSWYPNSMLLGEKYFVGGRTFEAQKAANCVVGIVQLDQYVSVRAQVVRSRRRIIRTVR